MPFLTMLRSVGGIPLLVAAIGQAQPTIVARPVASPDDAIATRQLLFHLSASTFAGMKAVADSGGDVSTLQFGAQGLVHWARSIPSMFPPGSLGPRSRARPEIWSDRAGFEGRATAYQAAAARLAAAARAGDRAAFLAGWQATRQACQDCHDRYRQPDASPPAQ
jgi:cytochrome c556